MVCDFSARPTKVTLALAMKGEMPLKRLSDDTVFKPVMDGQIHYRCLNIFSTSIYTDNSMSLSILLIFDHSALFHVLPVRGAVVFIFMQLLASILAALLALLTSGRHNSNIWAK